MNAIFVAIAASVAICQVTKVDVRQHEPVIVASFWYHGPVKLADNERRFINSCGASFSTPLSREDINAVARRVQANVNRERSTPVVVEVRIMDTKVYRQVEVEFVLKHSQLL